MTFAPTTVAPAQNWYVEAYINPNPNPNPNPYRALNLKPNHIHVSKFVIGEVSMAEQLSPEHMSCHHYFDRLFDRISIKTGSFCIVYWNLEIYMLQF